MSHPDPQHDPDGRIRTDDDRHAPTAPSKDWPSDLEWTWFEAVPSLLQTPISLLVYALDGVSVPDSSRVLRDALLELLRLRALGAK